MQAKCEFNPSFVLSSDAFGRNLQFFSGISSALFRIFRPNASANSCLLCCAIAFASSKTIRAWSLVVANEYTSADNSPSAHNIYNATAEDNVLFPFPRGTSR